MKDWWEGLQTRERAILLTGAGVLLVLLYYAYVWHPLGSENARLRDAVADQRETLAWMRESAATVKALRGSGPGAIAGLGGRSLLAVVDQSARQSGLGTALKRVEPDGQNRVTVRLEGAAFDTLVRWLDGLAVRRGVVATNVSVDRGDAAGLTDVRITLQISAS